MWYVRYWFREGGRSVRWYVEDGFVVEYPDGRLITMDEGPFERYLAEMTLADVGPDASVPRGAVRVKVERAVILHETER